MRSVINAFSAGRLAVILLCLSLTMWMYPSLASAQTSEQLYAEVDEIMHDIDALQTSINEEATHYVQAQKEHEEALAAAEEAQLRIEETKARLDSYKESLSVLVNQMYKQGGTASFLDVMLDSTSFDDFLLAWERMSMVSGQNVELIQGAKTAKANYEAAKEDYIQRTELAQRKMDEARIAQDNMAKKQEELRTEAAKLTEEALVKEAQEEVQRESALAAAQEAAEATEAARQALEEAEAAAAAEGAVPLSSDNSHNEIEKRKQEYDRLAALESEIDQSMAAQYEAIGRISFTHPLPSGSYSSGFGYRSLDGGSFHQGLDLAAKQGTPFYAAEAGTVVYVTKDGSYNGGAGNWIVIVHGNGFVTKYMHSSKVYVKAGDVVEAGQKIGAVGSTGYSYGPHLHFQVEYYGVAIDPEAFL